MKKYETGLTVYHYNKNYYNELISKKSTRIAPNIPEMKFEEWCFQLKNTDNEFFLKGRYLSKAKYFGSVSADIIFHDWTVDGYLMLPGAVYNGNRFTSRKIPYSPKLLDDKDIGVDSPIIISDIPRLNIEKGPSYIHERSGSLTIPVIVIFNPNINKLFTIIFDYKTPFGDTGIFIQEDQEGKTLKISLQSPVVRSLYKYTLTDTATPSDDSPLLTEHGDEVFIKFKITAFECNDISSVYPNLLKIFSSFTAGQTPVHSFPLWEAFKTIERKYNKQNWNEEPGYYSVGLRNGKYPFLQDWQIGWTGGLINTYPLLALGSETSKKRVKKEFKWLFDNGIAPSGMFYDSGERGSIWYGGDIRRKHTSNWQLIRKSGDGLFYAVKQLMVFKSMNEEIPEKWNKKLRNLTDKLVNIWHMYNQFGQFVDSITGEIVVGNSSSGAIIPAALMNACEWFGDYKYQEVAEESALKMYEDFVAKGYTCGGPGDALQCPDSESGYAMLEALVNIAERNRDTAWIQRAENTAVLLSSWIMMYNYEFPAESLYGKLKINTAGSVMANVQNKHLAPGFCTYSGNAFLRLYRLTGKTFFVDILQLMTRGITQYLSHQDRPIEGLMTGWISERINTTDWLEGIGETMNGSTWAEISLMLVFLEIPGIYYNEQYSLIRCFDQCTAFLDGEFLIVRNTSQYDSFYRFFYDTSNLNKFPDPTSFQELFIRAGDEVKVKIENK